MDCNREEAIRVMKELIENKMENRDFIGAKMFASQAEQLFPDLPNITQMVLVCDVHCSAENKPFGNEKDWYGILKVEPTADDDLIRKQYHKLALLLHHDKNKFPGAADAFTLIREAKMVLLDPVKRRRIHSGRSQVPMQNRSCQPDIRIHPWVQNNSNLASEFINLQAHELNACDTTNQCHVQDNSQYTRMSSTSKRSRQEKDVNETLDNPFMQSEFPSEAGQESNRNENSENAYGKMNKEEDTKRRKKSTKYSENCDSSTNIDSEEDKNFEECVDIPRQNFQCLNEENRRRSTRCRQRVNYCENLSDEYEEEDISFKMMTGMKRNDVPEGSLPIDQACISFSADLDIKHGNGYQDVSCPRFPIFAMKAVQSPCDMIGRDGKPHGIISPEDGVEVKLKCEGDTSSVDQKGKSKGNAHPTDRRSRINLGNNSSIDQSQIANCMMYNHLDPEFHNFDAERSLEKFQVGQCWAIYSNEDALPRYYGQIKKIDLIPNLVVHVAWFYACPPTKGIIRWNDNTMPIGCGMFKFLNKKLHEYTDFNAFSHQVVAEPMKKMGVYKIFPRTGEVWAIYKNWSAQMKCNKLEDWEYETVEIMDVTDRYVSVKFLVPIKGFKSVYKPRVEEEAKGTVKIFVAEQLMFSHQIPAFRLTEERGGSLRGFLELDPTAMLV